MSQLSFNYLCFKLETIYFYNIVTSKQVYKYIKIKAYLNNFGNVIRTLC